jgi:hypothetical protein
MPKVAFLLFQLQLGKQEMVLVAVKVVSQLLQVSLTVKLIV